MSEEEIKVDELLGDHNFTGIDFDTVEGEYGESYDIVYVQVDGKVYKFVENPDDGYRSQMEEYSIVADREMKNIFPPVPVVISCITEWPDHFADSSDCDIYLFVSKQTGLIILEVGTDYTVDYYPSTVSNYMPENIEVKSE